jgi:hypothetical protein
MNYLTLPNHFNHNHIEDFLKKFETVFHRKNKAEGAFNLGCMNVSKFSIVGLLLIYKLMEFIIANKCYSDPNVITDENDEFQKAIAKYRFKDLFEPIIKNQGPYKIQEYLDPFLVGTNLIIAPQPLLRNNKKSTEALRHRYSGDIENFYRANKIESTELILLCTSEIALNFLKHAVEDTYSVLVAEGNLSKIEISCADTGNGIISTLRQSSELFNSYSDEEVLAASVKKNVTSKPGTNHMGRGLYLIDRIATLTHGFFYIFSEGAFYKNKNGKIAIGKCGYWKGTFIYINMPLQHSLSIDDVLADELSELNKIKLNCQ